MDYEQVVKILSAYQHNTAVVSSTCSFYRYCKTQKREGKADIVITATDDAANLYSYFSPSTGWSSLDEARRQGFGDDIDAVVSFYREVRPLFRGSVIMVTHLS